MQTFLPYPGFAESAAVLDQRRLGKQRVETIQILRALTRPVYGWKHHPAVLMWKGHEEALAEYGLAMCREWCAQGRSDTCAATIIADLAEAGLPAPRSEAELIAAGAMPAWLGKGEFHRAHRSALVRKDPEWYRPLFSDVEDDLPYIWPSQQAKEDGRLH